ncbi:MAG: hypothetical protein PHV16_03505 [Candidatus Nanoarchaeia archaeon]|nr:hypothetical protein [Candidatus Nanoarchaeia archaeon]
MKNKKAQIKMFETIAVLLIFFVLVGFGLIFYMKFMRTSIEDTGEHQFDLKAIQTAQLVSFLPELQCTSPTSANIVIDDCFDVLKVKALANISKEPAYERINNEYYFDSFGYSKIYIENIYPYSPENWIVYERTLPNKKFQSSTKVPVSLYYPVTNSYSFGVLTVEVYG